MTKVLVNEVKPNPNERDFVANPLEIETETVGTLPKTRDEKQTAQETPFASVDFTATDVQGALEELFTLSDSQRQLLISAVGSPLNSASTYSNIISAILDGKTKIADTLLAKDVQANNQMSFEDLANCILLIQGTNNPSTGGIPTNLKLTDVIKATANMTYTIGLTTYLKPSETVAQVYKYIAAQSNITHYQENFNNTNASMFKYDKDVVIFDGVARIKDKYEFPLLDNGTYFETQEIDFAMAEINAITMDDTTNLFTLNGIKTNNAIVQSEGDIPIDETLVITGIGMTNQITGNGSVKVAVSRNKGLSWQSFVGADFVDVDIASTTDFAEKGMTSDVLNAVTSEQWQAYRDTATTIRFAYLINRPSYADAVGLDMVTIQAEMLARWIPALTSEYEYVFSETNQEYTFTFKVANDYKIRYLDKESE